MSNRILLAKIAGDAHIEREQAGTLLSHIRASRSVTAAYVHDSNFVRAGGQQSYTDGLVSALEILGAEAKDVEEYLKNIEETGDA